MMTLYLHCPKVLLKHAYCISYHILNFTFFSMETMKTEKEDKIKIDIIDGTRNLSQKKLNDYEMYLRQKTEKIIQHFDNLVALKKSKS